MSEQPGMMQEWEFRAKLEVEAEKGTRELVKFVALQQYKSEGLCHAMSDHMAQINGSVAETKKEIEEARLDRETIKADIEKKASVANLKYEILRQNQDDLPSRTWKQLPTTIKWSVVILILLLLANALIEGIGLKEVI